MRPGTPLYLFSGPTASGKTGLAHRLADRMGLRLLSVDSMMVYRGMDIGTAKPTPGEIERYDYAGLNLVDPGERFSTGDWLRAVERQLDGRPTLAVGGTGLYFRALVHGLEPEGGALEETPEADANTLGSEIRVLDPEALDRLADPHNPRRLARALAWLRAGKPLPSHWRERDEFPIPVLRRPSPELNERIHHRAADMFAAGLLEETRRLLDAGRLDGTAAQAIGYAEAAAALRGDLDRGQAIEAVAVRTRRYAKRQRTWFRNQMDARWIDLAADTDPGETTDRVAEVWEDTGPLVYP